VDSRLRGNDKQQISVLIGVNLCLTECYLKKQSQFAMESNEHKFNYNKEIREIYWIGHLVKTNPNKANSKPKQSHSQTEWGFFVYDPRDCHGPSDLAMTSISLLHCALVPLWLWHNLKKQSQFLKGENDVILM
jgi:hypothetical protein